MSTEIHKVISGPLPEPSNAQRNPFTTPVIGLRDKRICKSFGRVENEYATGVANNQNCVRNGRA